MVLERRPITCLDRLLDQVPAMVIPCIKTRLADPAPIAAASFYGSIVPAVWSFQLALRSRGLGSCFTTLHLAHEAEARDLLGIPDDITQVALLPVAYTTGDDFKPAVRGPVEHITYWNRWKATEPPAGQPDAPNLIGTCIIGPTDAHEVPPTRFRGGVAAT